MGKQRDLWQVDAPNLDDTIALPIQSMNDLSVRRMYFVYRDQNAGTSFPITEKMLYIP